MQREISRRSFLVSAAAFAAVAAVNLSGCGGGQASGSSSIKIGTMPTEDILPMWVAEKEGLFDANNVKAEVVVFDSAQNLSAALTAGEVDLAMTDPMRTVKLCESGTELTMEWITLGTDASQGRFGVLTSADSGFKTLSDLTRSEQGVGVAANTVPEYVLDMLCEQQGIDPDAVKRSEVPSLPDRFSLVSAGKLDAAALPGSMLALGEASGMLVIADDSKGKNISQSVMVARKAYNTGDGAKSVEAVRKAWDDAVEKINANPESYRELLAEKANLNAKVVDTYPISVYPLATKDGKSAYPPAELIDPQVEWMAKKGYSSKKITYNEADGSVTVA